MYDAVVAGGSISGLLTAREIAKNGHSVLVLEEGFEVGSPEHCGGLVSKNAAQVGHACVLGAEHVRKSHPEWFQIWWVGQEKVVVKVAGIKELDEVKMGAIELGLPWSEVTDAGHTQIAPGTTTCISVGPAPENLIDKVTGDLSLL